MVTEKYETNNNLDKLAKITVSVGKPDKTGRRNIGVEYTASMIDTDTMEEFESRFDWIKERALRELK